MDARERAIRQRLMDDFPHYAAKCLKIRTKAGAVESLVLNQAQTFLHFELEEQLEKTGRIRALIVKGRQQGCSTYVEGRFYHKVTHRHGVRAYILTRLDETTAALFEMTKRYQEHCPEVVRPHTRASNARELVFDVLDSAYKVGTAGSRGAGLGQTIQYFHGSEVAYWPNADRHIAGVLQAIPNAACTEIILESTSAGPQGVFYEMWQAASRGDSGYIPIFIPWFWQDEYREPVPKGFTRTEEEEVYARAYGVDDEQLQWRRTKTVECGSEINFKREYPATAEEAFALGPDTFFECWTPRTHSGTPWHVIPTGPIPPQCNYVLGMDWGFNDPCAIHLIAVWPDGRLNICRELYQRKRETRDLAIDLMRLCVANGLAKGSLKDETLDDDALIEAVKRGKVRLDHIQVFAGHDMFNRRLKSSGEYDQPIADIMRDLWGDYGPILISSGRDPLNRAVAWRDYLSDWGSDEGWPDGRPGIQIMECCENLIRTIPLLRSDPKNPEVVDTTMEEHNYDAVGHCLTSLPERPAKPKRPEEPIGRRKPVKKEPTHDIYDQVGWM